MICPSCGKKTIFDLKRCPACGCDPWAKPGEVLAAEISERARSGPSVQARRLVRLFVDRPKLSLVFVLLGTLQILISAIAYVAGTHPAVPRDPTLLDWLWALAVLVLPGLLLLAVGEGIAYLSAIRDALNRER